MQTILMSYKDEEIQVTITRENKQFTGGSCFIYHVRKHFSEHHISYETLVHTMFEAEQLADYYLNTINYEN